MIVIFNVKISNHRFFTHNRPNLKNYCRSEIFKYCLTSYSYFNSLVSRYFLFVQLDDELLAKKDEVEYHVNKTFPIEKTEVFWYRNNTIQDWQNNSHLWNSVQDDVLLFAGNDDHIFVDYNLASLKNAINILQHEDNQHSALYFSHWPEAIRMAFHHKAELHPSGDFVHFDWCNHDAIRIIRKELWNHYWFDLVGENMTSEGFYRTDVFNQMNEGKFPVKTFVPTKEMFRHFDGYSHVGGMFCSFPPLEIPEGFFDKKIQIKFGYDTIDDSFINVNPNAKYLKAEDIKGHDDWWTLEKMPLFWKDRIKHLDCNPNHTIDHRKSYNEKLKLSLKKRIDCHFVSFRDNYIPPELWIAKNLYSDI